MTTEREKASVNKIPWPGPQPFGFTVGGKIYLRNSLYKDYISGNPTPRTQATIAHENTHIERLGSGLEIYIRFWTDSRFRFQEELAAITEEMRVLKVANLDFDIKQRAKDLSSFSYLWCSDYQEAKEKMEEIWRSL